MTTDRLDVTAICSAITNNLDARALTGVEIATIYAALRERLGYDAAAMQKETPFDDALTASIVRDLTACANAIPAAAGVYNDLLF